VTQPFELNIDGNPIDEGNPIPVREFPIPNELRMDFDVRTDKQPVYLGKAPYDVAVEADPVWTVSKFTYESAANDARLLSIDVRVDIAWTDRATGW
jgi:hypothetical protein